jgi:hypothetical protein
VRAGLASAHGRAVYCWPKLQPHGQLDPPPRRRPAPPPGMSASGAKRTPHALSKPAIMVVHARRRQACLAVGSQDAGSLRHATCGSP